VIIWDLQSGKKSIGAAQLTICLAIALWTLWSSFDIGSLGEHDGTPGIELLIGNSADVFDNVMKQPIGFFANQLSNRYLFANQLSNRYPHAIILRQCAAHGQCINFHHDHSMHTALVSLNEPNEYISGRLVYATNSMLECPNRPCHNPD